MRWLLLSSLLLATCFAVITVHVIPHSHDDVGWLKTVDEYYLGANNSIQTAGVQYTLDTVIEELEKDPRKTFIFVEIAFFSRWWNEQSKSMHDRVRKLVSEKRFEFINGGWCMNDEASTSDEAIITQMTRGHTFIKANFDVIPTVGWQIDPFGHSNTMMSLFAQMGMSSVFFARMDYQDYDLRKAQQRLEYVWRPSKSLGKQSDIFAHMMWGETYCYPRDFDFEDGDAPINDDPSLENVNVQQRAQQFVNGVNDRLPHYRTSDTDVFVAFGCDFAYLNARINFKNMDKLMNYINARPDQFGMKVVYSTPSRYVEAVNARNLSWTLKTDDIFPYADSPHAFWTGYFTSRPALKGYVRSRNALLHAADKIIALFSNKTVLLPGQLRAVDVLRKAFSVSQHHDAVAGTEKQHVADDYAKLLHNGTVATYGAIEDVLMHASGVQGFQFCEYLNDTLCPPVTRALQAGEYVPLVLYNSLGLDRSDPVTVPCLPGTTVSGVKSQIWQNTFNGRYELTFIATVPAGGWAVYYLVPPSNMDAAALKEAMSSRRLRARNGRISNEFYSIDFNGSGGALSAVNGLSFNHNYLWYNESSGNNVASQQPDGAYIFRPNTSTPFPVGSGTNLNLQITTGPVFSVASFTFAPWVQSQVKLYTGQSFIEFVSRVGPIDISDGRGKEIIHRFNTPVVSNSTVYTDANWEEMQQRIYNYRPTWKLNQTEPVAGNYYPMNTAAFLRDSKLQATFLSDRSRGCGSLTSGQFESMLHRRLLFDDNRGVGEPLNESEAIITTERVTLATPSPSFRWEALRLNHPLQIAIGDGIRRPRSTAPVQGKGLQQQLPSNVHLMDFYLETPDLAIVRLRHLYAVDEALPFSAPATVDLSAIFPKSIASVDELQLSAVAPSSYLNQRLKWKVDGENYESVPLPVADKRRGFSFQLQPMQIRTFRVMFA